MESPYGDQKTHFSRQHVPTAPTMESAEWWDGEFLAVLTLGHVGWRVGSHWLLPGLQLHDPSAGRAVKAEC